MDRLCKARDKTCWYRTGVLECLDKYKDLEIAI